MVSGKVTIVNKLGLHARPAGLFVKEMANFKSDITIINAVNIINHYYVPGTALGTSLARF